MEVDLVEISPNAKPPVCKLIDFKKFKYLQAKKERQDKKGSRDSQTKEIRLGPFTDTHDLNVRIKRTDKFLKDGHRVKAVVRFMGREIAKKEFGQATINKFIEGLKDKGKVDIAPHFEGRTLVAILSPLKKTI